jgi:hypothetical protein
MKITLFLLFLICTTAALGQTANVLQGPNVQQQPVQFIDHPLHASQHDLAQPQNILEHSDYAYAQGEQPLWQFGVAYEPVPLGDVARAYRKQRAARKAQITLEK